MNSIVFPYDNALLEAVQGVPQSVSDVLNTMKTIDATCIDGDGLKWFNWLYSQVTQAVEDRVSGGGFNDPAWLSHLDVRFAALYFDALRASLAGASLPGCWSAMFSVRDQTRIARIQFALAGVNAHINHDLPLAIIATCQDTGKVPQHGTPEYSDYTSLNGNLDGLIETAKHTLNVRLLGDELPGASHLEDTIAAWNLSAARENAWNTAQGLWQQSSALIELHLDVIDGLTTVISKSLLVPVP